MRPPVYRMKSAKPHRRPFHAKYLVTYSCIWLNSIKVGTLLAIPASAVLTFFLANSFLWGFGRTQYACMPFDILTWTNDH